MKYAVYVAIVALLAGGNYHQWQISELNKKEIARQGQLIIAQQELIEDAQSRALAFSGKVAIEQKRAHSFRDELEALKRDDKNILDFLNLHIPDGLRESINDYLNRKTPDTGKPMSGAVQSGDCCRPDSGTRLSF